MAPHGLLLANSSPQFIKWINSKWDITSPFCALDFSDGLYVHGPGGKIKTGFYPVKRPSLLFLKLKTSAGILGKFNFTSTPKVKSHGEFS